MDYCGFCVRYSFHKRMDIYGERLYHLKGGRLCKTRRDSGKIPPCDKRAVYEIHIRQRAVTARLSVEKIKIENTAINR